MDQSYRVFCSTLEAHTTCAGKTFRLEPEIRVEGNKTTVTLKKEQCDGRQFDYVRFDADCTMRQPDGNGYLFYPTDFGGGIVKTDLTPDRSECEYHSLVSGMPICGIGGCEDALYVLVRGMASDCRFYVRFLNGQYRISPEIVLNGDDPDEDIVVEYVRMPNATYSDIARAYRAYQINERGCVPLRQRVQNRPILKKAVDTVEIRVRMGWKPIPTPVRHQTPENEPPMEIACTVENLNQIVDSLQAKGVKDAEICLVGWAVGGHDGRFPQQYPSDPRFGGDEALKAFIARAQSLGYMVVCHTVSCGAYEIANNWDRNLLTMKKGPSQIPEPYLRTNYLKNGLNGGDPWHLCPRTAYEHYGVKDLPVVRSYGYEGMHYIDEFTACTPEKCYSPDHPVSRRQAWEYYRKLARLSTELFGGFQSEAWVDYMNSDVDAILYTSSKSVLSRDIFELFDEGIPFWQLVYHGIVMSNATSQTVNYPIKEKFQELKFIEYGGRPLMYFNSKFGKDRNWMGDLDLYDHTPEQIDEATDAIKAAYDSYQSLKYLQYEFMEKHEKIADGVVQVTYSDGTVITVDYNRETYTVQKP